MDDEAPAVLAAAIVLTWPDEARAVLLSGMEWCKKLGDHDGRLDSVQQRGNRVVVAFSWLDTNDKLHDWAQALELKDGKVIDIQDYAKPSRAALAIRLRTALP